jgi:antitoxin MazE
MQVSKWGNSLAVRLPIAVVEELSLKEGDNIEITVRSRNRMEVARKPGPQELLAKIRELQGRVPSDFKFDREDANER